MCGRYASARSVDVIAGHFGAADVDEDLVPPGFNVAPTDRVLVVIEKDGTRRIAGMRWGLIPSWAADTSGAARLINARIEGLAEKPVFRTPLAQRRALVPADAYYEWFTRPGAQKQPHAIRPADGGLLAFAGLWERWHAPSGERILSCTIVTTASAGPVAYLHDRMPVVLPPDLWDDWLDTAQVGSGDALALLHAAGVPELVEHPVGTRVNDVRADGSDLLQEVPSVAVNEQLDLLA
ncbi:MAG: SOS response-associated peptidase [Actinomycetota bacterium]